jgi:putative hemolysin
MKTWFIIAIIILALALFGCTQNNQDDTTPVSDTDVHGCVTTNGYTWCEAKQKCVQAWTENCKITGPASGEPQQELANPASYNCISMHNGTLKIITDSNGGQVGMCTLPNGKICEEWALLRKECGE